MCTAVPVRSPSPAHPGHGADLDAHVEQLCAATRPGDVDAVHAELCRLRNALTDELRGHGLAARTHLAPPHAACVRELLREVDDILGSTADQLEAGCDCLTRTAAFAGRVNQHIKTSAGFGIEGGQRGGHDRGGGALLVARQDAHGNSD